MRVRVRADERRKSVCVDEERRRGEREEEQQRRRRGERGRPLSLITHVNVASSMEAVAMLRLCCSLIMRLLCAW